jgi:opacity protein-like surface antigen
MKLALSFLLVFGFALSAHAETIVVPASKAQKSEPVPEYSDSESADPLKRSLGSTHFNASLYYSLADTAKLEGGFDGGADFRSDEKTDGQLGIGISASRMGVNQLGFDTGINYEIERKFTGASFSIGNSHFNQTYSKKNTMSLADLYFNGNFLLSQGVYFFGGINFALINFSSDNMEFKGGLGYQIGVGYEVLDSLSIEAQYRLLRGTGTFDDGTNKGEIDRFAFDGAVIAAKYRFY